MEEILVEILVIIFRCLLDGLSDHPRNNIRRTAGVMPFAVGLGFQRFIGRIGRKIIAVVKGLFFGADRLPSAILLPVPGGAVQACPAAPAGLPGHW